MRKYILFILSLIPFVMEAQTSFTDGMKWRTQISGTHNPEPVTTIETVTIEKTSGDNIYDMYRFYEDNKSAKEYVAVIKTDGSKVYFKPVDSKTSDWYLLYDFGIKPGEGCFVYSLVTSSISSTPERTYIKCVGMEDSVECEGWHMLLEEYRDDSCSELLGTGSWIKGLSSLNGILYNNRFDVDGFCSKLLDVSVGGGILYSNRESGTKEMIEPPIPEITIDGLDIHITVNTEICGALYSMSGIKIGNYKFSRSPVVIKLSDSGIYILRIGNNSKKIFVP